MNDILAFVGNRQKEGAFGRFVDAVGEKAGYSLAVNLLSWLKRQKRFRHERELELRPDHEWCQNVPRLLEYDATLARLFEIANGNLRFRAEIGIDEREQVRGIADAGYQPVIRT